MAPGLPPILQRLARYAETSGGSVAVEAEDEPLTYFDLWRRATDLAGALHSAGVGPSDLVAVATGRGPQFVIACVAAWRIGAAHLPLDLTNPARRLRTILDEAQPAVMVVDDDTAGLGLGPEARVDGHPPSRGGLPGPTMDSPAYVIFTSGTTGQPKGVVVGHAALDNLIGWHLSAYNVTAADRAMHTAGLGFDASVWEIWPYLAAGATVVVCSDDDRVFVDALADRAGRSRCTIGFFATALAEELLGSGLVPDSLRYLLTGGDVLRMSGLPPVGCTLVNHYGPTEATVVTTAYRVVEANLEAAPPIGRPITGARVTLRDADLRPVAEGTVGEICVGGTVLANGYLRQPELTRERFIHLDDAAGRWYAPAMLVAGSTASWPSPAASTSASSRSAGCESTPPRSNSPSSPCPESRAPRLPSPGAAPTASWSRCWWRATVHPPGTYGPSWPTDSRRPTSQIASSFATGFR